MREYLKEAINLPMYIITHPIDGFYEMKYYKRGKKSIALVLFILAWISFSVYKQYAPFLINIFHPLAFNGLDDLFSLIGIILLWCISNWSITCLTEGEGKLAEIIMATCYALTPIVIITIPAVMVSYAFTLEEVTFFYLIIGISIVWFLILMFFGTMVVHNYSFTKTIVTIILTFIALLIIVFVITLCFTLIQQVVSFIISVYRELIFRG